MPRMRLLFVISATRKAQKWQNQPCGSKLTCQEVHHPCHAQGWRTFRMLGRRHADGFMQAEPLIR